MLEKIEIKRYRENINKEILFEGHTEGSKLVKWGRICGTSQHWEWVSVMETAHLLSLKQNIDKFLPNGQNYFLKQAAVMSVYFKQN